MYVLIEDSEQKIPHKNTFCAIGTVWIDIDNFYDVEHEIVKLRVKYNCWGEFKWNNVDKNHLDFYKEVIDLFFNKQAIKFNSIIYKKPSKKELKDYHERDKRLHLMKMIWMVIAHNYMRYKTNICLNKNLSLIADKPLLMRGDHKDDLINIFKNPKVMTRYVPIQKATMAQSHIVGGIQLTDLLTGLSLAHTCESYYPDNYSINSSKKQLRDFVLSKFGEIKASFTGPPDHNIRINNWFHVPKKF